MRSVFFCTSYITNADAWNSRHKRWLDFHRETTFGNTQFMFIGNVNNFKTHENEAVVVKPGDALPQNMPAVIRFPNHLERSSLLSYPGWWRSFLHAVDLAKAVGAPKTIHIESDAFTISQQMRDYINVLSSGWTIFGAASYNFPETAIQVICEDQFDTLASFKERAPSELKGKFAEELLPFTYINQDMIGDRYSEFRVPILRTGLLRSRKFNRLKLLQSDQFRERISADADFATQVTADQRIPIANA